MTDPIADMLTRIRNAQMVKKSELVLPYSKLKLNVLELLVQEGWLESVEKIELAPTKNTRKNNTTSRFTNLRVKLKYQPETRLPKINQLIRISKPGRRVYVSKENVPHVLNGKGLAIISTSKGLLTDRRAREQKIGGEVLCEIY